MLVKFRSPQAAEFVMFEGIARRLIAAMGCGPQIPSAITAEDIPAALRRLRAALAREQAETAPVPREDDEDEPAVPLTRRALPLLAMLEAAEAGNSHVMWET